MSQSHCTMHSTLRWGGRHGWNSQTKEPLPQLCVTELNSKFAALAYSRSVTNKSVRSTRADSSVSGDTVAHLASQHRHYLVANVGQHQKSPTPFLQRSFAESSNELPASVLRKYDSFGSNNGPPPQRSPLRRGICGKNSILGQLLSAAAAGSGGEALSICGLRQTDHVHRRGRVLPVKSSCGAYPKTRSGAGSPHGERECRAKVRCRCARDRDRKEASTIPLSISQCSRRCIRKPSR